MSGTHQNAINSTNVYGWMRWCLQAALECLVLWETQFLGSRENAPLLRRYGAPDVSITVMPAAGSEQDILRLTGKAYGYRRAPKKTLGKQPYTRHA